jgi:hypothetical protein
MHRELVEEVVLDGPDGLEARLLGDLHLLEGLPEAVVEGGLAPGTRALDLVQQVEAHGLSSAGWLG